MPAAAPITERDKPLLTCAQLREWVRTAQPRARLEYARGEPLSQVCWPQLRELVMVLAEKGFLSPHRIRDPETRHFVHIVQRGSRPVLKGMEL